MDYLKANPRRISLLALVLVFFASSAPLLARGPMVVVEESEFTAQPVRQGKSVKHGFIVLNQGDEPLQIFKVKPS